jgi:hypothetical protein
VPLSLAPSTNTFHSRLFVALPRSDRLSIPGLESGSASTKSVGWSFRALLTESSAELELARE